MLSKSQKAQFRGELFRHLDGLVTAPVAFALHERGVLNYLLEKKKMTVADLSAHFSANEGYLNVALRVLASQGWLDYQVDNSADSVTVSINDKSPVAFSLAGAYEEVVHLLQYSGQFHPRKFELEPFWVMARIMDRYQNEQIFDDSEDPHTQEIQRQILHHIEGALVGPTIVLLGMGGMFHKYFMEASFQAEEYHKDPESFGKILDFLTYLGWFSKKKDTYRFLDKGLFFAKRSSAYGVTVSYQPTFRRIDELIFGDPTIFDRADEHEPEQHVDRAMNVWGSGGAHSSYFKKIDEIIIDLFNQPIEKQPKGVLDMGCGNGAFLIHIFDVIEQRTLRGQMLEDYPLFLVGVDFNAAALKATRANLIKADIWAKVIWGDISDPQTLEDDLTENYDIRLHDLLNVRTFLDHNRIWSTPQGELSRESRSTGAFASRGQRLSNAAVERNLYEHLLQWQPYVKKFGLLLIELHTVAPELTARHLGQTAATAYDATHGFSDQYILEFSVFEQVVKEAGLHNDPRYFARFPDSDLATVSINFLRGDGG